MLMGVKRWCELTIDTITRTAKSARILRFVIEYTYLLWSWPWCVRSLEVDTNSVLRQIKTNIYV